MGGVVFLAKWHERIGDATGQNPISARRPPALRVWVRLALHITRAPPTMFALGVTMSLVSIDGDLQLCFEKIGQFCDP